MARQGAYNGSDKRSDKDCFRFGVKCIVNRASEFQPFRCYVVGQDNVERVSCMYTSCWPDRAVLCVTGSNGTRQPGRFSICGLP